MLSPIDHGRSRNPHLPREICSGVGFSLATQRLYLAKPSLRYFGVGTRPGASPGRSIPVRLPKPSRLAHRWISRPSPDPLASWPSR